MPTLVSMKRGRRPGGGPLNNFLSNFLRFLICMGLIHFAKAAEAANNGTCKTVMNPTSIIIDLLISSNASTHSSGPAEYEIGEYEQQIPSPTIQLPTLVPTVSRQVLDRNLTHFAMKLFGPPARALDLGVRPSCFPPRSSAIRILTARIEPIINGRYGFGLTPSSYEYAAWAVYDANGCELSCSDAYEPSIGNVFASVDLRSDHPNNNVFYAVLAVNFEAFERHRDKDWTVFVDICSDESTGGVPTRQVDLDTALAPFNTPTTLSNVPPVSCLVTTDRVLMSAMNVTAPLAVTNQETSVVYLLGAVHPKIALWYSLIDSNGCTVACDVFQNPDQGMTTGRSQLQMNPGETYTLVFMVPANVSLSDVNLASDVKLMVTALDFPNVPIIALDGIKTFRAVGSALSVFKFTSDPTSPFTSYILHLNHTAFSISAINSSSGMVDPYPFYDSATVDPFPAVEVRLNLKPGTIYALILHEPALNLTVMPSRCAIPSTLIAKPILLNEVGVITNASIVSGPFMSCSSAALLPLELAAFIFHPTTDKRHVLWIQAPGTTRFGSFSLVVVDPNGCFRRCADFDQSSAVLYMVLDDLLVGQNYYIGLMVHDAIGSAAPLVKLKMTVVDTTSVCPSLPLPSNMTRMVLRANSSLSFQDSDPRGVEYAYIPNNPGFLSNSLDGAREDLTVHYLRIYVVAIVVPEAIRAFVIPDVTRTGNTLMSIRNSAGCEVFTIETFSNSNTAVPQFTFNADDVYIATVFSTDSSFRSVIQPVCRDLRGTNITSLAPEDLNTVIKVPNLNQTLGTFGSCSRVGPQRLFRFRLNEFPQLPTNLFTFGGSALVLDALTGCEVLCIKGTTLIDDASLKALNPSREYLLGVEVLHPNTNVALVSREFIQCPLSSGVPVNEYESVEFVIGGTTRQIPYRAFSFVPRPMLLVGPCRQQHRYYSENFILHARVASTGRYRFVLRGYGLDTISVFNSSTGCELACSNQSDVTFQFRRGEIVTLVVSKRNVNGANCGPNCNSLVTSWESFTYRPTDLQVFTMDLRSSVQVFSEIAPRALAARVSISLRSMTVQFSSPVMLASTSSAAANYRVFPCSRVFTTSTVQATSPSSSCSLDPSGLNLTAFFDVPRSSLQRGSQIQFLPQALISPSSLFLDQTVPLKVRLPPAGAATRPVPSLVLASSTLLSRRCNDELVLELDESLGSAGRNFMDIQWSVITSNGSSSAVSDLFRQMSFSINGKVKSEIHIPVKALNAGNYRILSMGLSNWLGQFGVSNGPAISFSVVDNQVTPRVLLLRSFCPIVQQIGGNFTLPIFDVAEAFASFRTCVSDGATAGDDEPVEVFSTVPLTWRWELAPGIVLNPTVERFRSYVNVNVSVPSVFPKQVTVFAEFLDQTTGLTYSANSTCIIQMASPILFPSISGGNRTVSTVFEPTVALILNGGISGMPNPWTCTIASLQGQKCPAAVFIPQDLTALVNVSALAVEETYFFQGISDAGTATGFLIRQERPLNKSFQLSFTSGIPDIIGSIPVSASSRIRLKTLLQSTSASSRAPQFQWVSPEQQSMMVLDGIDLTQPDLGIPPRVLLMDGSTQTFTFNVQLLEHGQFASISFTVNAPSLGGSIHVSPSGAGPFPAFTDFGLRAVQFDDVNLPLRYMFGFAPCNGVDGTVDESLIVPLTPTFFLSNRMITKLPSGGRLLVLVKARDDLGAVSDLVGSEVCVTINNASNVDVGPMRSGGANMTAETVRDALALVTSIESPEDAHDFVLNLANANLDVASRESLWFTAQQHLVRLVASQHLQITQYERALNTSIDVQQRILSFLKALPMQQVLVDDEAINVRAASIQAVATVMKFTVGNASHQSNFTVSARQLVAEIQNVNLFRSLPGEPVAKFTSEFVDVAFLTTTPRTILNGTQTLLDRYLIETITSDEQNELGPLDVLHVATGTFRIDPFPLVQPDTLLAEVAYLEFVRDADLNEIKLESVNVTISFLLPSKALVDVNVSLLTCGFFDHTQWIWSTFGCTLTTVADSPAQQLCECNHTSDYSIWLEDVQTTLGANFNEVSHGYVIVICLLLLLVGTTILYYIAVKEDSKEIERRIQLLLFATRLRPHIVPERFLKTMLVALENNSAVDYQALEAFDVALMESNLSLARSQLRAILNGYESQGRLTRLKDAIFCVALMRKHRILSTLYIFDPFLTRSRRVIVGALFILCQMFVNALFFTFRFANDPDQFFIGTLIAVSIICIIVVSAIVFLIGFVMKRTPPSKDGRRIYYCQLMVIFLCEWMTATEKYEREVSQWMQFGGFSAFNRIIPGAPIELTIPNTAQQSLSWEKVELVHRYQQLKRILDAKKRFRKKKHDVWRPMALNDLNDEIEVLVREVGAAYDDLTMPSLGERLNNREQSRRFMNKFKSSSASDTPTNSENGAGNDWHRPLPRLPPLKHHITVDSYFTQPLSRAQTLITRDDDDDGQEGDGVFTGVRVWLMSLFSLRGKVQDNAIQPTPPTFRLNHSGLIILVKVVIVAFVFLALYYILAFGFSKTNSIVIGWIPALALSFLLDMLVIQPIVIISFFVVWRYVEEKYYCPDDKVDVEDDEEDDGDDADDVETHAQADFTTAVVDPATTTVAELPTTNSESSDADLPDHPEGSDIVNERQELSKGSSGAPRRGSGEDGQHSPTLTSTGGEEKAEFDEGRTGHNGNDDEVSLDQV